ncbi:MAG: sugar ABC transporter ATP-binding protein, partial [Verrucomicrobia bacterium]|nr:sugar ABC transporter ATP-binding protein [Verrucomicrobiota bacterium]
AKGQKIARDALAELQAANVPLRLPVNRLSIAQRQLIEIARTLTKVPKVLILDEPTSSLSQKDTRHLFGVIRRLAATGVGIIYISHFLEEARELCQRFTILRDGATVATGALAETERAAIIHYMIGRELKEIYPRVPHKIGKSVLEVEDLVPLNRKGPVSFSLHEGEIFGIAGLVGAGRTETLRSCFGLDQPRGGRIKVFGAESTHSNARFRLRQKCGMLSENRKEEGLMLQRDLADNLTITNFQRLGKFGFISRSRQLEQTVEWIKRLRIKAYNPRQRVEDLSGGNQQKVAVGRLLYHGAQILLLDEPTRGIDVGSKAQIYEIIGQLAAGSVAVLMTSSYLPELLGVCDTIGVMSRGALVEVRPASRWNETEIIQAAVGDVSHLTN